MQQTEAYRTVLRASYLEFILNYMQIFLFLKKTLLETVLILLYIVGNDISWRPHDPQTPKI